MKINLGTSSFVSEFSVMDPPIELDVRPPETQSTVAGNDIPDNAGWIETKHLRCEKIYFQRKGSHRKRWRK